jgi:hypothetical protein
MESSHLAVDQIGTWYLEGTASKALGCVGGKRVSIPSPNTDCQEERASQSGMARRGSVALEKICDLTCHVENLRWRIENRQIPEC